MGWMVLLLCSLMAVQGWAANQASPDPAALKAQANSEVQVAAQLMQQAQSYLQGRISKDKMQMSLDLYVKAGQMAEHAAKLYQALGPQIASTSDVQNSTDMVRQCLFAIEQIKKKAVPK